MYICIHVLQCVAVCCSVFICLESTQQHTATHCNTQQHIATHCSTMQHIAACDTLQHNAAHCSTLQHTVAHYNTLQHTATHCNTSQPVRRGVEITFEALIISLILGTPRVTFIEAIPAKWNVLSVIWVPGSPMDCAPIAPTALVYEVCCCSVLQCVAVCCSVAVSCLAVNCLGV